MEELKLKKDDVADVLIDMPDYKLEILGCKVFANSTKENEIVFIVQDPKDPNKKIQIILKKVV